MDDSCGAATTDLALVARKGCQRSIRNGPTLFPLFPTLYPSLFGISLALCPFVPKTINLLHSYPAGFVTREDGGGDVFVHQSDIHAEGFRSLRDQEPVEFELEEIGEGRYKAAKVRLEKNAAKKNVFFFLPYPRFFFVSHSHPDCRSSTDSCARAHARRMRENFPFLLT